MFSKRGFEHFSEPYKNPWFWVEAGLAALPAARMGAEAVETAFAIRKAQKIATEAYEIAKVTQIKP